MSFCIDTHRLVSIRSFAAAEAHFNSTAQIRGYDKEVYGVPLRYDRSNWRSMRLMKRPYGYAARLYQTDVVQWYADGTMRVNASYNSRSTNAFANAYLPYAVSVDTLRGKPVLNSENGRFPLSYGEARISPCKDDTNMTAWRVDTASVPPMCYPKLNLKRAAAARKRLAPLMAYLTTLEALGYISEETWRAMRGDDPSYMTTADQMVNPEMFAAVAARQYRNWYDSPSGGTVHRLDPKAKATLTERFYKLTGCHDSIMLEPGTTHRLMRKYEGE